MADFWIISCYCHFLTINDCLKQLWIWSKFQGKMIERFSTTELISDVHLALDCDNWYLIINQIHICTSNERRGFENFVSFYLRCQQFYLGNILFPGKSNSFQHSCILIGNWKCTFCYYCNFFNDSNPEFQRWSPWILFFWANWLRSIFQ